MAIPMELSRDPKPQFVLRVDKHSMEVGGEASV